MVAGDKTAEKIRKSIFNSTKPLIKQPLLGATEENLIELQQGHRYLVEGNYKIIYRLIGNTIYVTDVFDAGKIQSK